MTIKTVEELLAESQTKKEESIIDSFVAQLLQDSISGKIRWESNSEDCIEHNHNNEYVIRITDGVWVVGEGEEDHEHFKLEVADSANVRKQTFFLVCEESSVKGEQNSLKDLYVAAVRAAQHKVKNCFDIIERYLCESQQKKVVHDITRVYQEIQKKTD